MKQSFSAWDILDEIIWLVDICAHCIYHESILEGNQFVLKLDKAYFWIIVENLDLVLDILL